MHELQVILEDLRNQLTIIKAYIQIYQPSDNRQRELLINPVNNADTLTEEALNILKMSRYRDMPY
ncbi:MAG: hypothetical protein JL50_05370 [Peptococcaceae bacterium BICA1-7]|nr:MAG: hypothetical protein JL50_05370 [Peptococcaceae bacterium BICA1-7]HBV96041.1 hypothetical protein [Desulfotomaculum sp.]